MKRCISLVLSVLIVLASITSALSFPVSAEGENTSTAIVVEDFESGTLDPAKWTTPDSNKCIVSDGLLSQAPGGAIFHSLSTPLESAVEYSVSFDYKIVDVEKITDDSSYLGFFRVGFINDNDTLFGSNFAMHWSPVTTSNRTKTDWQSFSMTITPNSDVVEKAKRFVIGSFDDNFNSTILIDNIRVCKKEDAATLTAEASAGGTVNGVSGTYKKATVKGDSVTLTATANTGYKFMGWYDNSTSPISYDNASLKSSNSTYEFNLTSDVKLKAIFVKEITKGELFNFDFTTDDYISECEIYNQDTTSNFTPKITGDGSYVEGNQGASLQKAVSLKANVKYTMTFDFRFMSGDVDKLGKTDFYRAGFTKSFGKIDASNKATTSDYYKIYHKTPAEKTTKCTHTYEFTPDKDLLVYAVIGQYSDPTAGFEIYNWKLTAEDVTVTTVADGRGSVNKVGSVPFGTQTTVTATPDEGYKFTGWYNDETLVSADAEYTFTAEKSVTLTAKFELDENAVVSNYIVNGDFEEDPGEQTIFPNVPNGNYDESDSQHVAYFHTTGVWGRIMSGVTRMDWTASSVADTENGTHYLKSGATTDTNQYIRAFGQFVQLPVGDYKLTFIAKSNNSSYFVAGVYSQPSVTSGTAIAKLSLSESENWKPYGLNFKIDTAGYYQIAFGGNTQGKGDVTFAIDNVVLREKPAVTKVDITTVAETGGTVSQSVNEEVGKSVTVTATPNEGYSFEGWYNGETKVSTDAVYTFTVTEAVTLTAKFKQDEPSAPVSNYIVNGDFETQPNTGKIYAPSSYDPNNSEHVAAFHNTGVWGRIMSGVTRMDWTESTNAAINGTHYLTSGATTDDNQYIRVFGQFVQLPAGDYVLSFIAKSNSSSDFVAGVYSQPSVTGSTAIAKLTLSETETWQQYVLNFKIDTAGYYQIAFGGNTQGKGDVTFAIDNVVVCKEADFITVTAVTDGGGTVSAPFGKQTIGEQVTVVATPDEYYSFAGWYIGTNLVSADPSYTFTVTGSVKLKAEFKLNLDEGSIVKNGNFNINSTLGWIVRKTGNGSGDLTVQVDPDTGSAVAVATNPGYVLFQKVHLEKDVDYVISFDFKFENGESIPSTYTSFYRLAFAKEPTGLSSSNLVGFTGANPYYSIYDNSDATNLSKWKNHSINFKPTEDLDAYLAIGGVNELGGASFSVDNIGIYRKSDASVISVSAVSHGGSGTVTSSKEGVVLPGQTVTVSATPDRGSSFGGWYENGTLVSNELSFTYTVVKSNTLLYARFLNPNALKSKQMLTNNDFSTGDLSGWNIGNTESATSTAKIMTENGDTFVRLSKSDTLYQTVELEPGKTYMVRLTSRIKDIAKVDYDKGFYRFGLSKLEKPNTLQSGSITEAPDYSYSKPYFIDQDIQGTNEEKLAPTTKWREYTYVYSNTSDSTMLVNVVVGIPYCTYPLDVLKLEFFEYGDGVIDFNPTVLYGEDFYDSVQNGNFEGKLSAANWGNTLPKGWQILTGHKETGNRYLSVSGNKSRIYTFPVTAQNTYLVAFSLRTASAGTSTVSIVDKNGNPLGDAYETIPDKAVFSPKANNKWQRMGAYIYCSGDNGDNNIRIKITGGTNQLDIDDITVTKIGYATHETFVGYTGPTTTDYSALKIYNPTAYYSLEDDTVINTADNTVTENGGNGDSDITEDNNYGDNANTGDYSNIQLAVILFAISFVLVAGGFIIALRMKNRRKGGNN